MLTSLPRGERPLVVIAGSVAQRPRLAGHAWVFLQYLLGFRRLGWDVLFLDRLTDDMLTSEDSSAVPAIKYRSHATWFLQVMRRAGVRDGYSLSLPGGVEVGLRRAEVIRRARRAAFILDVNGFLRDEEISSATPLRVFLDIDPGFNQMWHELGLANVLDGYDAFLTVAQRIGQPDCLIPTCGRTWIPTLPPVVLDAWPAKPPRPQGAFTSIASWRGPFAPVTYRGSRYGLRAHEFRRLTAVASESSERFELALDIHVSDQADRENLLQHGWALTDPAVVSSRLPEYQAFIRRSQGEFAVAKEMYVKSRSGWISDRSVCYLASGRPVVLQDTGLRDVFDQLEGVGIFASVGEALAQLREATRKYRLWSAGARRVAERIFASDIVLTRLLGSLAVRPLRHEQVDPRRAAENPR